MNSWHPSVCHAAALDLSTKWAVSALANFSWTLFALSSEALFSLEFTHMMNIHFTDNYCHPWTAPLKPNFSQHPSFLSLFWQHEAYDFSCFNNAPSSVVLDLGQITMMRFRTHFLYTTLDVLGKRKRHVPLTFLCAALNPTPECGVRAHWMNKMLLCCNLVLQFRCLLWTIECSDIIFQYFQVFLRNCRYWKESQSLNWLW